MDEQSLRRAKRIRAQIYRDLRKRNERRAEVAARILEARHGSQIQRILQVAREHKSSHRR